MVGVSLGSAVSEGGMVVEEDWVSAGRRAGRVGEEQEMRRRRQKAESKRCAMGLDIGGILTY